MIEVSKIFKSYGEINALRNISFDIGKGELFGFIGSDGAGKSTLFRILCTLLLPDSGSAMINGYDIVRDYQQIRMITGYMPGRFSLYTDLTIEENLEFFATVFSTTIKENYHLIRDVYVQIEPFKKRLAGKLSGGMKQKLALSCALIHQPMILILDEPTTGVDAVSRYEFWQLLKGLKEKGITIIVSTPYMDEANLCDRIALIQKGKIMTIDTPEKIVKSFKKPLYSIQSNNQYEILKELRDFELTETVFPFGQELHYTPNREISDIGIIKKRLLERGFGEATIRSIEPGIEDIFMSLMTEGMLEETQPENLNKNT
jgi:ABC-2 type transport system ATP-binding protein